MSRFDKVLATAWILGLASLLTDVSTEMIHSVLPNYMSVVLKASFTQIGLIEGAAEALASLLVFMAFIWASARGCFPLWYRDWCRTICAVQLLV